jgi:hypothetical protein
MCAISRTLRILGFASIVLSCGLAFGQRGMKAGGNPRMSEGGGKVNPLDVLDKVGDLIGKIPQGNGGGGGHHHHHDDWDDDDGYYEPDYYYPTQPNYYYPPASVTPYVPATAAPATVAPPSNKVPSQKATVIAATRSNSKLLPKAMQLTSADLAASQAAMEKRIKSEIKDAVSAAIPTSAVTAELSALPTPPYTAAEKLQIRDAILAGDSAKVAILSKGSSPQIEKLQQMAEVHEKANALQEKVAAGEATTADFRNFQNDLAAIAPAGATDQIEDSIATLKVQNQISGLLTTAVPGSGLTSIPFDEDLSLISLPGLPPGQLISLGNGAAIVGSGASGSMAVSMGNPLSSFGVAIAPGQPVPTGSAAATNGTLLSNPAANGSSISYLVNGATYTMQAGYQQPLASGTTWAISFDPGNGSGTQSQTLGTGIYEFTVESGAWVLRKKQIQIEIDNRENSIDFHYVIGAASHTVRAGESATHSGDSTIALAFDNGAGKSETKHLSSGTYRVGVTDDGERVDLFTGEQSTPEGSFVEKRHTKSASKIGALFGK